MNRRDQAKVRYEALTYEIALNEEKQRQYAADLERARQAMQHLHVEHDALLHKLAQARKDMFDP